MRIRLDSLLWDDATIDKLWRKHRVEWWEVEEAIFDDEEARFRWHEDRRHGRRLLVRGRTSGGRRLLVVLHPVEAEAGVWRCRTAWEEKSR
jgi:hypothetical protein